MTTLDLLLYNTRVADVFRLRFFEGWVGVRDGRFLHVEEGAPPADLQAREQRNLHERILAPGLVDSHMHIESSLITPRRFAQAVLPHGTTTILSDPHEVANVAGEAGVRWMMRAAEGLPLRVYHAIPSCVPATSPDLEWTAQAFDAQVVRRLAGEPSVIALGELMDYRGVLREDDRKRAMALAARQAGLLVEGHVPTLQGIELSEYLALGVSSDHTLTHPHKIAEQVSKGLAVMLQTKSLTAENMAAVAALPDRSRILLVTDDIEPSLLMRGHLSLMIQWAVEAGMPLLEALASATIRPARYLNLRDLGAIAPGYRADFLVLDELTAFPPCEVFVDGRVVAAGGALLIHELPALPTPPAACAVPGPFEAQDFRLVANGNGSTRVVANAVVIENDVNSLTGLERIPVRVEDGYVRFSANDSLALAAVFARDRSSQTIGIVKNLGLREGAFASSLAHDSHNLLVIGRAAQDMVTAANAVHSLGGGVVVARGGQVLASLALPILGLLSDRPLAAVASDFAAIEQALWELGVSHQRPFLLLSVMSLSVSPCFKFTDKGVVDTEQRCLLPPWE